MPVCVVFSLMLDLQSFVKPSQDTPSSQFTWCLFKSFSVLHIEVPHKNINLCDQQIQEWHLVQQPWLQHKKTLTMPVCVVFWLMLDLQSFVKPSQDTPSSQFTWCLFKSFSVLHIEVPHKNINLCDQQIQEWHLVQQPWLQHKKTLTMNVSVVFWLVLDLQSFVKPFTG